jgi:cytochrome o ubiquinol oxidase operon protein cyoD
MDHAVADHGGAGHGSLGTYITGFILAIILTVIPFALVMYSGWSELTILLSIFGLALVQMLVHLHFFLHLDRSSEQSWNVAAIAFTALAAVVVVGGSLWVMIELHYYMQPGATVVGALAHAFA